MFGKSQIESMLEVLSVVCPAIGDSPASVQVAFWRKLYATGIEAEQVIEWATDRAVSRRAGEKYLQLDDVVRWGRSHATPSRAPAIAEPSGGRVGPKPVVLSHIERLWAHDEEVAESIVAVCRGVENAAWYEAAHTYVHFPARAYRKHPWFFGPSEFEGKAYRCILDAAAFRDWVRRERASKGVDPCYNGELHQYDLATPTAASALAEASGGPARRLRVDLVDEALAVPVEDRVPQQASLWADLSALHEGFSAGGPVGAMAELVEAGRVSERELAEILRAARDLHAWVCPASPQNPFLAEIAPRERFHWRWDRPRACAFISHSVVKLAWSRGVDTDAIFARRAEKAGVA